MPKKKAQCSSSAIDAVENSGRDEGADDHLHTREFRQDHILRTYQLIILAEVHNPTSDKRTRQKGNKVPIAQVVEPATNEAVITGVHAIVGSCS